MLMTQPSLHQLSHFLRSLNTDLNNIALSWQNNQLQIDATKTVSWVFHSPPISLDIPPSLCIGNYVISISGEARFFGVILDTELKFRRHASSLTKKIEFGIHISIKTQTYFLPHMIRSLYVAYIHSHISY